MVHKEYVKKKRTRKIVILATCVTGVAVTAFSIVAFLGKELGDFTVSIQNDGPQLSISQTGDFTDATSFLRIDKVKPFEVWTNSALPSDDEIDNKSTTASIGERVDSKNEVNSIYFFKLTFFVKNVGTVVANYNEDLTIVSAVKDTTTNSYGLDDILRVRFYSNKSDTTTGLESSSHNYVTYAKESDNLHYDADGNATHKEYIAGSGTGLCESFLSDTEICNTEQTNLGINEVIRYTILYYLEGEDTECNGAKPVDSNIKLNLSFKTYVNNEEETTNDAE